MNDMLLYLVKFTLSLSLVTIFYQLFLRKLTFYNWNRWYLLVYPLGCFMLPLLDIGWWLEADRVDLSALQQLPALGNWTPTSATVSSVNFNYWYLLNGILVSGSIIMAIRILIQYLSYRRLSKRAALLGGEDIKLYAVPEKIIPFSFGRSVYINPALHSEADLNDIIRHEMVHVRQHHTADMMLAEFLLVLNWFNPFAWILRHAIRQNLEFIADRQVLTHGVDRRQYQYLLVKVVGQRNFSMASHLNFSALKTRIVMMNKIRSARIHLLKFAFAVPLAAILLLAFRKKQELQEIPESVNSSALLRLVQDEGQVAENRNDTVPSSKKSYLAGPTDKGYHIRITEKNGVGEVTILDQKKKKVKSMSLEEWNANKAQYEKQYGELPPPPPPPPAPPGPAKASPVAPSAPVSPVAPAHPAVPAAPPVPVKQNLLVISEGDSKVVVDEEQNATISGSRVKLNMPKDGGPLYFVNGKEWTKEDVSLIDPNRIKAIHVLKNEQAVAKYGERGKEGVILIDTKSENVVVEPGSKLEPITVTGFAKSESSPLYIVDGSEMSPDEFKKMKPESIESITVYKDKKAIERFGANGKNGVIVVTRKKQ
ncbi:hypothetical protein GCM10027036_01780 [Flavihumibacter cheonanensis]|uniref:M56 family metallopeptidase n=1 Tax=Flavihumibacter cheonanensis TaxID=1442385 RepID=UPI001EF78A24|nr:M56 family metallopeptidase [Flavihumibacter cheonanensis]MCG7752374.1 hypothetical protein [Flavihumibacter cheonanensis]